MNSTNPSYNFNVLLNLPDTNWTKNIVNVWYIWFISKAYFGKVSGTKLVSYCVSVMEGGPISSAFFA